ncbi:MAG: DUF4350 domain-containing protein [Planctomycetes bacterium]|nr:DUF4350 domain-containing protein [Planctomycetota bacterium]
MPNRFVFWFCAVCVFGGLWAFYALAAYASRGGEQAPLYSVRRYDPYGTAALYQVLERQGIDVSTIEQTRIPEHASPSTLIQILDRPAAGLDEGLLEFGSRPTLDPERLKKWMFDGNTVIQFSGFNTALMRICGVPHIDDDDSHGWRDIEAAMRSGTAPDDLEWMTYEARLVEGGPLSDKLSVSQLLLQFHSPRLLSSKKTKTWQPIALTGASGVSASVMGIKQVGDGRLVVVSSPTLVLNGWLNVDGNLEVLLALVGDDRVLIDEWSHGFGHGGTIIAFITRLGLLPALVQVGFVILLFAWSTRGVQSPRLEQAVRRRSSVEQIVTLGQLYSEVLGPEDLSARTQVEVKRRIANALGCPVSAIEKRLGNHDAKVRDAANNLLTAIDVDQSHSPRSTENDDRCHRCGYNLHGNVSGICPECGAKASELDKQIRRATTPSTADVRTQKRVEANTRRVLTSSFEFSRELVIESDN